MKTLLLDRTSWDLALDATGNIAVASDPYSQVQDAASAIRLFRGEYIFDVSLGIPYFQQTLGKRPPINLLRRQQQNAALSVHGVTNAKIVYSGFSDGQLSGQVQIKTANGSTLAAAF